MSLRFWLVAVFLAAVLLGAGGGMIAAALEIGSLPHSCSYGPGTV